MGDVGTDIGHRDTRNLTLNDGSLRGIVVNKDKRIDTEVEFLCDLSDVLVLGSQLALKQEMCSSLRIESGCSNPCLAISSVFFEQTARRTPRLRCDRQYCWKAV